MSFPSRVEGLYLRSSQHQVIKEPKEMQTLANKMSKSKRARKAIESWKRDIAVKTKAGDFAMYIDNGNFKVEEKELESPDFVMACEDPRTLLDGLMYKGAITDSVIMKRLWISKNIEINTIGVGT